MSAREADPAMPGADPLRLTSFSHGGGCGCKISPGVLSQLLQGAARLPVPPQLLVGLDTADDAAVYRIDDEHALVATTDFFMPIVDDPHDFGRIAAANALSDVYAMGASPILALAIVAMPVDRLPLDVIRRILQGGESICASAGIPLAGGHTIDSVEPIYGLVAIGLANPSHIRRNDEARPGDRLVLGKPLGVGIASAALRKERLSPEGYATMIASTTQLNASGPALARVPGVHAMTDVTGFGLLGHALEMCRGARVRMRLSSASMPLLPGTGQRLAEGFVTGASARNWAAYGHEVQFSAGAPESLRALLTDPQTSGGLLVACDPSALDEVLGILHRDGFASACEIGEVLSGEPGVEVR
ncbi:MAG: selenide, water dikinase SelD [Burkholderiales bacterium]|jgi:selenide,water dikinase|nr:MAG: selenide, water dikinase SelD [Burkholderiales bacterium]